MKKLKLLLIVCLLAGTEIASAQTAGYNSVQVYDHITLKGKKISGVSNDTTMVNGDSSMLTTEFAVKGYLKNQLASFSLPVGHTYVVPSQDSMLNLNNPATMPRPATIGDVVSIPDSNKTYILKDTPTTTLGNWVIVLTPAQVITFNSRSGNIVPETGDYTHSQITGLDSILNSKMNSTGNITETVNGAKTFLNITVPTVADNDVSGHAASTQWVESNYKGKSDTTNATTGYTTLYQNSLKASLDKVKADSVDLAAGISANATKVDTVANITQLSAYNKSAKILVVTDTLQGGLFVKSSTGTVDNGTVFSASGGGFWLRQYNGPVMFEWFGAEGDGITNDAIVIQNALNTNFKHFSGKSGHTFIIDRPISAQSKSNIEGKFTFKRSNQAETVVTQAITAGTYTNPVINVANGNAFQVGQYVAFLDTVSNKWINRNAVYKITATTSTSVTLGGSLTIDSSFSANSTIFYTSFSLLNLSSDCAASNFFINGNVTNNTYGRWVSQVELETTGDNNTVNNVKIDSTSGEGIIVFGKNNRFYSVRETNLNGNGFHFSGDNNTLVSGATIINSNLDLNVGHQGGSVTWSDSCKNVTIENCWLENGLYCFGNMTSPNGGNVILHGNIGVNARNGVMQANESANNEIDNFSLSDNHFYNCVSLYIAQTNAANASTYSKIDISHNHFYNTAIEAIGVNHLSITGNTVEDTSFVYNSTLIKVSNSKNVSIQNNKVVGGYYGIYINNSLIDSMVSVSNNQLWHQRLTGIYGGGNSTISINNNTVYSTPS